MRYDARWDSEARVPLSGTGIWDVQAGQWIATEMPGRTASLHAALLNLRYDDFDQERPDEHCRCVDPPRSAILQLTPSRTEPVELHMWLRQPDGWHGWITYSNRHPRDPGRWYPAKQLRPTEQEAEPVDNVRRWRRVGAQEPTLRSNADDRLLRGPAWYQ